MEKLIILGSSIILNACTTPQDKFSHLVAVESKPVMPLKIL